ncbi:MAG: hypothetical protein SVE93_00995 [Candidatus Thermoplasmatota archaeon]|nr:hypothetical protein [Candidatus Thermoplasmatota archaeon]
MKSLAVVLSLLLLGLIPVSAYAQQQPVILPEPVPIEETPESQPQQEQPQQEQPQQEQPQEYAGVLDIWENAFNTMLQSGSVFSWISICFSAVFNTIPYIPQMVERALRLIPRSCVFLIRVARALPSILESFWTLLSSLPSYIRMLIDLIQQMLDLAATCIRILPQMLGSSAQQPQQPQQSSLLDLLRIVGTLMQ